MAHHREEPKRSLPRKIWEMNKSNKKGTTALTTTTSVVQNDVTIPKDHSDPDDAKTNRKSNRGERLSCFKTAKLFLREPQNSGKMAPKPSPGANITCTLVAKIMAASALNKSEQRPPRSALLLLPVEIIQKIASHLDTNGALLLRLTCRTIYAIVPVPTAPRTATEVDTFFHLIRDMIPKNLEYCRECRKYHPWARNDYYLWYTQQLCLRNHDRKGRAYIDLVIAKRFVCRHCLYVRPILRCRSCFKCESCAQVRFKGEVNLPGAGTYCIDCDEGRERCKTCHRVRLSHQACRICGMCEACAGCRFQFGRVQCELCSRGKITPSTRKTEV